MGRAQSWPIIVDATSPVNTAKPKAKRRKSRRPLRTKSSKQTRSPRVRGVKSTGLFLVPSGDGNSIELVVYLSSFSTQPQTVKVGVNHVVNNALQPLFFQTVDVGAGEARKITVFDVENQMVEVTIATPSNDILPSAAVVKTFLADGATVTVAYKSPADFVRV